MSYLFTILTVFCASLIQSVTGFGFGIFVMLFFPHFIGRYGEATALSGLLSLCLSAIVALTHYKHINFKNLFFPILGSSVTSFLAVQFMTQQSDSTLILLLGIFLVILSVYFMFFSDKIKIKPTWYSGLIAGCISGVLSGLFSTGGPPMVIYYMQTEKDVKGYLATIQTFFMLAGMLNTVYKSAAGMVTPNVLIFFAVGLVSVISGTFLGKRIFNKLNAKLLKKCIYGMMAISGVINIVTSLI